MCSLHLTHPSAHTWSSGQPTLRRPGSSWGFGALPKGLTSVMNTSCQSWDSNPQPWVTLGFKSNALSIRPRLPPKKSAFSNKINVPFEWQMEILCSVHAVFTHNWTKLTQAKNHNGFKWLNFIFWVLALCPFQLYRDIWHWTVLHKAYHFDFKYPFMRMLMVCAIMWTLTRWPQAAAVTEMSS